MSLRLEYMVSLLVQCYQCGKILELDDGFRGGVCRCSQCGSLLRVPMTDTHQVQKARPAEPAASKAKPIPGVTGDSQDGAYDDSRTPPARPEAPGTSSSRQLRPESPGAIAGSGGMRPARPESPLADNLPQRPTRPGDGDIGVSSGIRSRQSQPHRHPPNSRKSPAAMHHKTDGRRRKWSNLPIGVYAGLVAGFLLIVVIGMVLAIRAMTAGGASSPRVKSVKSSPKDAAPRLVRFLRIPIQAKTVVFSLDGSSANANSFNSLAALVKRTVTELPTSTRVKIAIWEPTGLKVFPAQGWLSPKNLKATFSRLLVYSPYGSTSITKMMLGTLKLGASQNIITTQKIIVPGKLATAVGRKVGPKQTIDIISVNGEEHILKKIAQSTGGQFQMISVTDLQSLLSE